MLIIKAPTKKDWRHYREMQALNAIFNGSVNAVSSLASPMSLRQLRALARGNSADARSLRQFLNSGGPKK